MLSASGSFELSFGLFLVSCFVLGHFDILTFWRGQILSDNVCTVLGQILNMRIIPESAQSFFGRRQKVKRSKIQESRNPAKNPKIQKSKIPSPILTVTR